MKVWTNIRGRIRRGWLGEGEVGEEGKRGERWCGIALLI